MTRIDHRKLLAAQLENFESPRWQAFELGYGVRLNITSGRIASLKRRIANIDKAFKGQPQ